MHLSRFAEELVLWSTPQFGFVRMPEAFTSGSSIMPQKRNPDAAELVRGKSGRILGDLQALLVVLKGLPLAYSKDMQEDKEGVFDAADSLELCLAAMAAMLAGIAVDADADAGRRRRRLHHRHRPRRLAGARARACRSARRTAWRRGWCRLAEDKGCGLEALTLAELQAVDPRIEAAALAMLGVDSSVASRRSFGGTAPERVRGGRGRPPSAPAPADGQGRAAQPSDHLRRSDLASAACRLRRMRRQRVR